MGKNTTVCILVRKPHPASLPTSKKRYFIPSRDLLILLIMHPFIFIFAPDAIIYLLILICQPHFFFPIFYFFYLISPPSYLLFNVMYFPIFTPPDKKKLFFWGGGIGMSCCFPAINTPGL
jgi:hypothetical protein